ncbi:MAG: ParB/RepB/Spo0J family partition protein [Clostridiales bacterium]|nr:ParB/RepB/Spo0J family partition protein [Clostridiales bacterium]
MENLVYIPVAEISPHPDNPRKDLGDLTELIDSIKANGILQNLTVIRGHRLTAAELDGAKEDLAFAKERNSPLAEELEEIIDSGMSDDGYTVIIGHRRLAAAKAAGLKEVPCVVAEMTHREQVQTMLAENMLRSDLTVYEQAEGFQMMLDLGATVKEIAEESGISQSTVRYRVKLLKLDKAEFKASEERGGTLQDYMELEKLHSQEQKNKVLATIGTNNFAWTLKQALEEERQQKWATETEAALAAFATNADGVDAAMELVKSYTPYNAPKIEVPEDAETREYYYATPTSAYFYLYRKKDASQMAQDAERDRKRTERERKEAETNRRLEALKEASDRAYQLRADFVKGLSPTKAAKNRSTIMRFAYDLMLSNPYDSPDRELLAELIFPDLAVTENDIDEDCDDELRLELSRVDAEYALLCVAYATKECKESDHYYERRWENGGWCVQYAPNDDLDMLYEFLADLGYEMSDEELALQNGTHELFQTGEEGE